METKQFQLLMPEGELVRTGVISADKRKSNLRYSIYEGVIDSEDAFAVQAYSQGYPTRLIHSLRCSRNFLEYDSGKNIAVFQSPETNIILYDVNHPKNSILKRIMEEKGIWEEPSRL